MADPNASPLNETGLPNVEPARIDFTGVNAPRVNVDFFQELALDVSDDNGATSFDLDLTGADTSPTPDSVAYLVYVKAKPSDLDADALGTGSVTDTTNEATGQLTVHIPDTVWASANAGQAWWSLSVVITAAASPPSVDGAIIPLAYGLVDLKEFAQAAQ